MLMRHVGYQYPTPPKTRRVLCQLSYLQVGMVYPLPERGI